MTRIDKFHIEITKSILGYIDSLEEMGIKNKSHQQLLVNQLVENSFSLKNEKENIIRLKRIK